MFALQVLAIFLFVRVAYSAIGPLIHPKHQQTAAPLPPYQAGLTAQNSDLVKVCQNEDATSGRLTIWYVTGNSSLAALYFQEVGSRSEHYLQMPAGWGEKVDTYQVTLDHAGQETDISGKPTGKQCAWLKIKSDIP